MNIGLIDVDKTKFPNLALMKLSAWYKSRGDKTYLLTADDVLVGGSLFTQYDKLLAACVFTENRVVCEKLAAIGVDVGGSGYDMSSALPDEVEHIYPDYSLYDIKNEAYGFLSRGCPRGCPFCIVAGKEGRQSHKVADLSEWWRGQKYIKLLDPNLLACADRIDLLRQLVDSKATVDVTQGFDARLLDDEVIELVNALKIKMVHFAWDNPRDIKCRDALERFAKANTWDSRKRCVYVLTNYWSTMQEDLMRVYWLRDNGYNPYVMIYDKPHASKQIRRLQRWVNNKYIFRSCERFEDYR